MPKTSTARKHALTTLFTSNLAPALRAMFCTECRGTGVNLEDNDFACSVCGGAGTSKLHTIQQEINANAQMMEENKRTMTTAAKNLRGINEALTEAFDPENMGTTAEMANLGDSLIERIDEVIASLDPEV